jgi:nitrate reductase NapE component
MRLMVKLRKTLIFWAKVAVIFVGAYVFCVGLYDLLAFKGVPHP